MKGLAEGMNVTTNNIANISTIGFKQQGILFSDVFYAQQGGIGDWWNAQDNSRVALGQVGMGLQVESVRTMLRKISYREGVGDLASRGVKALAKAIDTNEMYVIPKPLEMDALEKLLMDFGLMEAC